MKSSKLLFPMLLLLFSAKSAYGVNIVEQCKKHKSFIEAGLNSAVPIAQIITEASNKDLIFIGESHFEEDARNFYKIFLNDLLSKDKSFNCVFLEQDVKELGEELERCNSNHKFLDKNLLSSKTQSACGFSNYDWASLQNEAFKNKVKVYAVDAFEDCANVKNPSSYKVNNCRDTHMQKAIQEKFDSGVCTKAISINGAPHITSVFKGYKPLGQRKFYSRQKKNLKVFNINFLISGLAPSEGIYDPRWRWMDWAEAFEFEYEVPKELCIEKYRPVQTKNVIGFLHKDLRVKAHPYVWINRQPRGNWMDFDASIVVGPDHAY